MPQLFKRVIEASFLKYNNQVMSGPFVTNEIVTIKNFRMSFDIKKTSSTDPNTCTFTAYNLSNNTAQKLNDDKGLLTIKAGYEKANNIETIFIGNVSLTKIIKDSTETIVTIEARDGELPLLITRDAISFKEGVTVKQILKSIIKKFGIAIKTNIEEVNFINKNYSSGFAYMGELKGLLDKLAKDAGLSWSIQNNELKIYNKNSTDKSTQIIVNQNTGLIGAPEKIKFKKTNVTNEIEINGYIVNFLLQPKAEPGGSMLLSSQSVGDNKEFRIETVAHVGDNFDGDFKTTAEVTEIG